MPGAAGATLRIGPLLLADRHQPGVTCTLIGPRTAEQLEDNLRSLDVTLTIEELAAVDRILPPGGQTVAYYEVASPLAGTEGKNFGPHLFRT